MESHLLQMRGLKPVAPEPSTAVKVASFTDAWIETADCRLVGVRTESHLLQMRGLKQNTIKKIDQEIESHLLQMRGLKQKRAKRFLRGKRRIFYRCVD